MLPFLLATQGIYSLIYISPTACQYLKTDINFAHLSSYPSSSCKVFSDLLRPVQWRGSGDSPACQCWPTFRRAPLSSVTCKPPADVITGRPCRTLLPIIIMRPYLFRSLPFILFRISSSWRTTLYLAFLFLRTPKSHVIRYYYALNNHN